MYADAYSSHAVVAICVLTAAAVIAFAWPRSKSAKGTGKYDPATGIGRGAPGFRTSYADQKQM